MRHVRNNNTGFVPCTTVPWTSSYDITQCYTQHTDTVSTTFIILIRNGSSACNNTRKVCFKIRYDKEYNFLFQNKLKKNWPCNTCSKSGVRTCPSRPKLADFQTKCYCQVQTAQALRANITEIMLAKYG